MKATIRSYVLMFAGLFCAACSTGEPDDSQAALELAAVSDVQGITSNGGTGVLTLGGESHEVDIMACTEMAGVFRVVGSRDGVALSLGKDGRETVVDVSRGPVDAENLRHTYVENWSTLEITSFSREGDEITATGSLRGSRMEGPGDASTFGPMQPLEDADRPFSLWVYCP